jgi:integrase/recombinase XerD
MIKRRARAASLGDRLCCHSFRATGITNYLDNGGTIEKARQIVAHESTLQGGRENRFVTL